jgi:hypothetical protein
MEYKHTQWGYYGVPVLLLFAVIAVQFISADDESSTMFTVAVVAGMAAVLAVLSLFSRLDVTVSGGTVVAAFGFGWPRRVIELGRGHGRPSSAQPVVVRLGHSQGISPWVDVQRVGPRRR